MEQGRLFVSKTKKGKIAGQIQFENGKKMPIPPHYCLEESLDGKECQVKREKGQIVRLMVDGKELTEIRGSRTGPKTEKTKKSGRAKKTDARERAVHSKSGYVSASATAPYNFIPLNECVVEADFDPDSIFNDTFHAERFTGFIELELENLTPLYIRDAFNPYENSTNDTDDKENPDFFSPGGKVKIPGSSLRGMTRMMVEIVSWGKFTFFDDRLLYYRGLADKSSLGKEYQANMSSYGRKTKSSKYKFNAGYLKKDGFKYYIIPASKDSAGREFTQIHKNSLSNSANRKFEYEERTDGKYIVFSGDMPKKEHHWLINKPDYKASELPISEHDIEAYRNDTGRFTDKEQQDDSRKRDGDLLRQVKVSSNGMVPCFYVRWKDSRGNDRISFGHTGYFRLAYRKSIGDHIPVTVKESEKIDVPEALFGKETKFASRVFFEDLEILPGQDDAIMDELSPKILSSPKPTTFQHYLEQNTNDINSLKHWNDASNIRGHKLYWHKQINNSPGVWKEDKPNTNDPLHTIIRPVKPNTRFKGKIRFVNLSDVELGALLFVLDLPENHYHKLGMGKPLGLGSVKITLKLFVSDRVKRYTKLFGNSKWELGEQEQCINEFKNKFEKYMLERITDERQKESLWDTERLKQLKTMLDWNNTQIKDWLNRTAYMDFNLFKNRPVLQKPSQITNK